MVSSWPLGQWSCLQMGHHRGFQGVPEVLWWVLLIILSQAFKKSLGGYGGSGSATGSQKHPLTQTRPLWRPSGSLKRYRGACWGTFYGLPNVRSSGGADHPTVSTITIWTSYMPPWWSGWRTCPGRRLRSCCKTALPATPYTIIWLKAYERIIKSILHGGLHGDPNRVCVQGGE